MRDPEAESDPKSRIVTTTLVIAVVLYLYRERAEVGELLPNPQLLRVADAYVTGMNGDTRAPYIVL